jgi:hypothetical protein
VLLDFKLKQKGFFPCLEFLLTLEDVICVEKWETHNIVLKDQTMEYRTKKKNPLLNKKVKEQQIEHIK